jgi:hypothetical protein
MLTSKDNIKIVLLAAIVGTITSLGVSWASNHGGTDPVPFDGEFDAADGLIPYQGYLDKDGSPYNGALDFQFSLVNHPTDPALVDCDSASAGEACYFWQEVQTDLHVSQGRFSAVLGSENSIGEAVLAEKKLFLEIEITDPATNTSATLDGRQRIMPVPYAWRATPNTSFRADDGLNVANGATISGSATFNDDAEFQGGVTTHGGIELRNERLHLLSQANDDDVLEYNTNGPRLSGRNSVSLGIQNAGTYTEHLSVSSDGVGDLDVDENATLSHGGESVIKDIVILNCGSGCPCPDGYERINTDLNKDAGGDHLYLCFQRADPSSVPAP